MYIKEILSGIGQMILGFIIIGTGIRWTQSEDILALVAVIGGSIVIRGIIKILHRDTL